MVSRSRKEHFEVYNGAKIYCADVTPGRSFGYDLAIKIAGVPDQVFAQTTTIWAKTDDGWPYARFSIRFRTGDVVDGIRAARKWIDQNHPPASEIVTNLKSEEQEIAELTTEIDHALRTWDNYVRNEVSPSLREKMAKPTAENLLFRLLRKRLCSADTTLEEVETILDTLWLTNSEAAWLFDIPLARIKKAVERGKIERAEQRGGVWHFPRWAFKNWLADHPGKGPPRPRKAVTT